MMIIIIFSFFVIKWIQTKFKVAVDRKKDSHTAATIITNSMESRNIFEKIK